MVTPWCILKIVAAIERDTETQKEKSGASGIFVITGVARGHICVLKDAAEDETR